MPETTETTARPDPSSTTGPGEVHPEPTSSVESGGGVPKGKQSENSLPTEPEQVEKVRPKWETAWDLKEYWDARKTFFTEDERAKAWDKTAELVKTYSDEMVKRWNEEIDTLLVFAGLFSAILTAFNVQSYQLLTPAPTVDPVIVALEKISAQLSSFSVNPPSVNSTQPAFVRPDPTPSSPPLWAVWLNALWFSSLIFSLSAASVGIMVKQWLNEYSSGLSGTSRQVARLRQLRLNSLERWHVKEIVAVLPVLLQIASALFFAGLLILLWQLDRTVAIVASLLVGVLAIFSLTTIVLPSFATHCSYLSPPSRALYELTRPLRKLLYLGRRQVASWICYCGDSEQFLEEHPRICSVVMRIYTENSSSTLKWRGMELSLLSKLKNQLDGDMVAKAYTTGMDIDYLHQAAVCTTELSPDVSTQCFQAIASANATHWGEDHRLPMREVHPCMWSGAIVALVTDPPIDMDSPQSSFANAVKTAYQYLSVDNRRVVSDISWTRLVCADFAGIIRHYDRDMFPPGVLNIAERLLDWDLLSLLLRLADIGLGNDVRRHVASAYQQEWNRRLTSADEDETGLALVDSLQFTVVCIPSPSSPDYKPNDPEYQAVVFNALRELHEKNADLLSPKLIEAMSKFLDMTHENERWEWGDGRRNADWITALKHNLLDDSEQGQIPAADNVQSTSLGTSATLPPVVDSTLVITVPGTSSPADSAHHAIQGTSPASRNSSPASMTSPGSKSTMGSPGPEGPTVPQAEVAPPTTSTGNAPATNVSWTATVEEEEEEKHRVRDAGAASPDATVRTAVAGASESPPVDSGVERNGISDFSEVRAPSDHSSSTSTAPSSSRRDDADAS
ncbi:hypothetical protein L226DRAFT_527579 [Lentinus tigrinus ALCF2SS1-7]|uniref:uncharacterized protein n=1 Tax=Lentinus tigrinus ALCF2SS1-7 TaxID=1328758 RepID=UPI001165CC8E|nr:hypothetical protein L226DRAFT_527579 [Lentinus tigrinus ALCF2SS1-7]